jgi:outer membrane protein TolC
MAGFWKLVLPKLLLVMSCLGGEAPAEARVLTLDEAVALALRDAAAVRIGASAVEATDARRGVAEAGYLPSLSAAVSYTRQTGNTSPRPGFLPASFTLTDPTGTSYSAYNFSLSLAQPVYDFGRTAGVNDQAEASAAAAEAELAVRRLAVCHEVVLRYHGVLAADEMVGVAVRARDQARVHAGRASSFFAAGSRPKIDVLRTEADFQSAEAALLGARDEAIVARVGLLAAVGAREWFEVEVVWPPEPSEAEDGTAISPGVADEATMAEALGARPERLALLARIEGQEAAVRTLRANLLPTLGLAASFTDAGQSLSEWRYWNWAAGLTLTVPLLAVLPTRHQVREARALATGLRATLDGTDVALRAEVMQASARLRDARARLVPVQAALGAAREALHLAEGRYQAGSGNYVELLDAQAASANSEAALVRARLDVATARAAWRRSLGACAGSGTPGAEEAVR